MLLTYFMDGLKMDMMLKHMPFLSSLHHMPLESEFGYSCACHATMYTGKYIDEHNTWFVWKKGENSPYRFVDRVPLLKYMNWLPVKVIVSKVARKLHKNRSFSGIPMLVNLPLKYWSLFQPCEDRFWSDDDYLPKYQTLFKLLKKNGIPHDIVALKKNADVFQDETKVNYAADEFVYYFIGEVDSYMHSHGENAQESIDYLKKVDAFIQRTYEKAKACHEDVELIAFSDHGHIDTDKKIDINDYFKPLSLNVNNYIHLIESTFARFWPRNEGESKAIMKALNVMCDQKLGFLLDKAYQDRYHLNFETDEHGAIIFHLAAPNIFTNTIWGYGKTIRSMHGYEPTLPKHQGVFASNKPLIEKEHALLTDILPTILHELRMPADGLALAGQPLLKEE